MKHTVTTETVETTEIEVTICDKCGLEAEEPVPLYARLHREAYKNPTDTPTEYTSRLRFETNDMPPSRAHIYKLPPMTTIVEELVTCEPVVELCADCFDEVFGWGEGDADE